MASKIPVIVMPHFNISLHLIRHNGKITPFSSLKRFNELKGQSLPSYIFYEYLCGILKLPVIMLDSIFCYIKYNIMDSAVLYTYLGVNPIEHRGTYFPENMHAVACLTVLLAIWVLAHASLFSEYT